MEGLQNPRRHEEMGSEYITGINYWPIDSGINWWRRFDKSVVGEDFSRIKETNLYVIRIFLLWEDFQPFPRKVSIEAIDHLVTVLEIANKIGLKILPTFFTGHMSGVSFLPPWMLDFGEGNSRFPIYSEGRKRNNRIKNFYKDREVMESQKILIREISNALKGHPSLWSWDLGNEPSNLFMPDSTEESLIWLEEMISELKKGDESIPVTLGLHQGDLEEDRKMGPKDVGRFCDFLSMHTYSIYAKYSESSLDEDIVPFLGLITRWLGSKEVLIEEVGIPSSDSFKDERVISEENAFNFYERLLKKLNNYPFIGTMFWCYGDYRKNLWDNPPLDENEHERYFGLFREDRSPKPFVSLIRDFQKKERKEGITYDWIDIEPEEYFKDHLTHLKRLYRKFKEQQE